MVNKLPETAMQHIVERPKHLDLIGRSGKSSQYAKIAETLKLMERSKALCYDKVEFEREFGKTGKYYLRLICKKNGLKKNSGRARRAKGLHLV